MKKSTLMRRVEKENGASLETVLIRLRAEGYSRERMARHLNVSYWTIRNWQEAVEKAQDEVAP